MRLPSWLLPNWLLPVAVLVAAVWANFAEPTLLRSLRNKTFDLNSAKTVPPLRN